MEVLGEQRDVVVVWILLVWLSGIKSDVRKTQGGECSLNTSHLSA